MKQSHNEVGSRLLKVTGMLPSYNLSMQNQIKNKLESWGLKKKWRIQSLNIKKSFISLMLENFNFTIYFFHEIIFLVALPGN